MYIETAQTNDDNSAVLATDSDVSTGFIAETHDIGALGANNAGERRSVGHSEEADVGLTRRALNRLLDERLRLVKTGLVTGLECPDGLHVFALRLVGHDLPLRFSPVSDVVNAG